MHNQKIRIQIENFAPDNSVFQNKKIQHCAIKSCLCKEVVLERTAGKHRRNCHQC